MVTFITVIHYLVSVFLIIIILVQHGKGADVGATFGGANQTVFGARGSATFLHKLTTVAMITFVVTSISLTYISSQKSKGSVMADQKPKQAGSAVAGKEEKKEEETTAPEKKEVKKAETKKEIDTKKEAETKEEKGKKPSNQTTEKKGETP